MLPLSEADPFVKAAVTKIVGSCHCRPEFKRLWKGHESDELDPKCVYHAVGEAVADLVRDNRRLKQTLQRIHHQSRKAPQ